MSANNYTFTDFYIFFLRGDEDNDYYASSMDDWRYLTKWNATFIGCQGWAMKGSTPKYPLWVGYDTNYLKILWNGGNSPELLTPESQFYFVIGSLGY